MRQYLALLILVCLAVAGCGRIAPGIIIGEDGQMLSATDANIRLTAVQTIERQLDAQLGGHWRCEAVIVELPVYGPHERGSDDGWMWPKLTANVTLVGDGVGASLLSEADVSAAVVEYLLPKVERPRRNLTVTVGSVTDAARFAKRSGATPSAPSLAAPTPTPATTPVVPPAAPVVVSAPGALPPVSAAPVLTAGASVASAAAGPAAPPRPQQVPGNLTVPAPSGVERALAPGERIYTIQPGDSLADISLAFYGTPDHWRRIADANPGTSAGVLKAGTAIVIPAKP